MLVVYDYNIKWNDDEFIETGKILVIDGVNVKVQKILEVDFIAEKVKIIGYPI